MESTITGPFGDCVPAAVRARLAEDAFAEAGTLRFGGIGVFLVVMMRGAGVYLDVVRDSGGCSSSDRATRRGSWCFGVDWQPQQCIKGSAHPSQPVLKLETPKQVMSGERNAPHHINTLEGRLTLELENNLESSEI